MSVVSAINLLLKAAVFILTKQAIAVYGKAVFISYCRVVNSNIDIRQLSIL